MVYDNMAKEFILPSGRIIPAIGLGTWQQQSGQELNWFTCSCMVYDNMAKEFILPSGRIIPAIGLGTWQQQSGQELNWFTCSCMVYDNMAKEFILPSGRIIPAIGLGTWQQQSGQELNWFTCSCMVYDNMAKEFILPSGRIIPAIGLGTWQGTKSELKIAVKAALDAGYRMIDTAYFYLNEQYIGEALEEYINEGKLQREDIFVTTKLACIYARPSDVKLSITESLRKLRLDYIDLFLYHFPISLQNPGDPNNVTPVVDGKIAVDETVDMCGVWKVMEKLVDEGKTKHIGISNFNSEQVETICKTAKIKPVVNQVECHPYLPQYKLQAFCEERGILLTAYSPLGSPGRGAAVEMKHKDTKAEPVLMEEDIIISLAKKYNKTPAQVYDFQLTNEDMDAIKVLEDGKRFFNFAGLQGVRGYPFDIPF